MGHSATACGYRIQIQIFRAKVVSQQINDMAEKMTFTFYGKKCEFFFGDFCVLIS